MKNPLVRYPAGTVVDRATHIAEWGDVSYQIGGVDPPDDALLIEEDVVDADPPVDLLDELSALKARVAALEK